MKANIGKSTGQTNSPKIIDKLQASSFSSTQFWMPEVYDELTTSRTAGVRCKRQQLAICHRSNERTTWRSSSVGLPVECSNEVSIVVNFPSCQLCWSSPTLIQHPSGIFKPKWEVKIKFRPSEWGATPLPGAWRAKQTPRTARGMSSFRSKSYVFGNTAQFSTFQTPNRCRRNALQPVPMTFDCQAESPEKRDGLFSPSAFAFASKFCSNSSMMMWALASSSAAQGKFAASEKASQYGCIEKMKKLVICYEWCKLYQPRISYLRSKSVNVLFRRLMSWRYRLW